MYTVIVYDYDAAPDAECYHVGKRIKCKSLRDAKLDAIEYVEEKFYVGAKVLDDAGQVVCPCPERGRHR